MMILERVRGENALIIDGEKEIIVPAHMLMGCCEGDAVFFCDGFYITDREATRQRRKEIISLQDSLWDGDDQ